MLKIFKKEKRIEPTHSGEERIYDLAEKVLEHQMRSLSRHSPDAVTTYYEDYDERLMSWCRRYTRVEGRRGISRGDISHRTRGEDGSSLVGGVLIRTGTTTKELTGVGYTMFCDPISGLVIVKKEGFLDTYATHDHSHELYIGKRSVLRQDTFGRRVQPTSSEYGECIDLFFEGTRKFTYDSGDGWRTTFEGKDLGGEVKGYWTLEEYCSSAVLQGDEEKAGTIADKILTTMPAGVVEKRALRACVIGGRPVCSSAKLKEVFIAEDVSAQDYASRLEELTVKSVLDLWQAEYFHASTSASGLHRDGEYLERMKRMTLGPKPIDAQKLSLTEAARRGAVLLH